MSFLVTIIRIEKEKKIKDKIFERVTWRKQVSRGALLLYTYDNIKYNSEKYNNDHKNVHIY